MTDRFSDIPKLVNKVLKEATKPANLKAVGNEARSLVQKRTRLGGGVEKNEGPRTKLKPLSGPYKKQRKTLRKNNELSQKTTPAKSNLTQTGQMIDDIAVFVRRGLVRLGFDSKEAEQKAKWVQDAGRKFFFISKPEARQLRIFVRKQIDSILRKIK